MVVQICIGSSCHLKGSYEIVELFQAALQEHALEERVTLSGSFCIGKCNREGVTVQVDDTVHTGITPDGFPAFFETYILNKL
ncbi:MAG: (2Fe-2S) ferredoxin domain-containing protein [Clostridia bacterium]|nr:(2Fe-2S) ferredoxin domain-containing protein [Oscillospiraceae bacterium]MBQ7033377.1 (2Fe-2S) ferredoxin domain-containing protein [Clostridia bacterium]